MVKKDKVINMQQWIFRAQIYKCYEFFTACVAFILRTESPKDGKITAPSLPVDLTEESLQKPTRRHSYALKGPWVWGNLGVVNPFMAIPPQ
jgi:hypothetical protein